MKTTLLKKGPSSRTYHPTLLSVAPEGQSTRIYFCLFLTQLLQRSLLFIRILAAITFFRQASKTFPIDNCCKSQSRVSSSSVVFFAVVCRLVLESVYESVLLESFPSMNRKSNHNPANTALDPSHRSTDHVLSCSSAISFSLTSIAISRNQSDLNF